MNNTKSNGPNIDPWGTPDLACRVFENVLLIETLCFLSRR